MRTSLRCGRACVPPTALPADHSHTHTREAQICSRLEKGFNTISVVKNHLDVLILGSDKTDVDNCFFLF